MGDSKGASPADPHIFEETHAAADHVVVQLTMQGNFPAKFQKPSAYLLAACNRKFASLLHAYAHDHFIVFVCSDATTADRVRTFASDLLVQMREDSQTFRLRLDGIGALDKGQVSQLASRLGRLQTVDMKGARTELYGDYAIITTKAPLGWSWPQSLRYQVYGVELEARLSLAPVREEAPGNAERKSSADGRDVGTGWQGVKTKPKVAKAESCRDFARGVCTRGDKCIFRHCKEPCRDAVRGRCTRQNCRFEHQAPTPAAADVKPRSPAPRGADDADANPSEGIAEDGKAGSEPVITRCLDFERGRCHRNFCKFEHGAASPSPRLETGSNGSSSSKSGNYSEIPVLRAQASVAPTSPGTSSQDSTPRRRPGRSRREGSDEDGGKSDAEDEDELAGDLVMRDGTPPGSPTRAQQHARSRSPCPLPGSPRSEWTKGGLSSQEPPAPKRHKAHSSEPPSPAAAAATAAQHAAPPNGADPQAL